MSRNDERTDPRNLEFPHVDLSDPPPDPGNPRRPGNCPDCSSPNVDHEIEFLPLRRTQGVLVDPSVTHFGKCLDCGFYFGSLLTEKREVTMLHVRSGFGRRHAM